VSKKVRESAWRLSPPADAPWAIDAHAKPLADVESSCWPLSVRRPPAVGAESSVYGNDRATRSPLLDARSCCTKLRVAARAVRSELPAPAPHRRPGNPVLLAIAAHPRRAVGGRAYVILIMNAVGDDLRGVAEGCRVRIIGGFGTRLTYVHNVRWPIVGDGQLVLSTRTRPSPLRSYLSESSQSPIVIPGQRYAGRVLNPVRIFCPGYLDPKERQLSLEASRDKPDVTRHANLFILN
jgi:hypothetical protein